MDERRSALQVFGEDLYMLLAMARVRNGGVGQARYDISLRYEEEVRRTTLR